MPDSRDLFGRTIIYTDAEEITSANIAEVLSDAVDTHGDNEDDADYLYDYYKGDQLIKSRTKTYNDTVVNKIVVNRCKQITDFNIGYLLSSSIQYVDAAANDTDEDVENNDLNQLNTWMRLCNKDRHDITLARWQSITGTGYRMALPKADGERLDDEDPPFDIYDLDPRYTFVVYSSRLGHKPMLGVTYVTLEDDTVLYYCYTDSEYICIDGDDNILESSPHILGTVPIIEYPLNDARLGDFEPVIPLQDAINAEESDRQDSEDQLVDAILCVSGMQIDDETNFMTMLKEQRGLILPENAKAWYLTLEHNQQQAQTLIDGYYDELLTICGMPNRNGGSSTSDTGAATILRDGWSDTETRARQKENMFKESEREFLRLVLLICNSMGGTDLYLSDIDIVFPRRAYSNDSSNVANLITMLSNDWVPPEWALEHSNLTPDPHRDWLKFKKWHDAQEAADVDELASINAETDEHEGVE